MNKEKHNRKFYTEEERHILELDFGDMPRKINGKILRYI